MIQIPTSAWSNDRSHSTKLVPNGEIAISELNMKFKKRKMMYQKWQRLGNMGNDGFGDKEIGLLGLKTEGFEIKKL